MLPVAPLLPHASPPLPPSHSLHLPLPFTVLPLHYSPLLPQMTNHHKPHDPSTAQPHPPTHLPTGSAVNEHARPVSPADDGSGSYGHPPAVYVGADDHHKAHPV